MGRLGENVVGTEGVSQVKLKREAEGEGLRQVVRGKEGLGE